MHNHRQRCPRIPSSGPDPSVRQIWPTLWASRIVGGMTAVRPRIGRGYRWISCTARTPHVSLRSSVPTACMPGGRRIVAALAGLLDYPSNQGLLHRGVKPGNIMTIGTVGCSAPEQLVGDQVDGRAVQCARPRRLPSSYRYHVAPAPARDGTPGAGLGTAFARTSAAVQT